MSVCPLQILHKLRNSTNPTAQSACTTHPVINLPAGVAKAAAAARASVQGLLSASAAKAADAWLLCQQCVQQLAQRVGLPDVQPAVAVPLIMASGAARPSAFYSLSLEPGAASAAGPEGGLGVRPGRTVTR